MKFMHFHRLAPRVSAGMLAGCTSMWIFWERVMVTRACLYAVPKAMSNPPQAER